MSLHPDHHLGCPSIAAHEVEALWNEYEAASSPEALLVKDLDKLEMIVQVRNFCELPTDGVGQAVGSMTLSASIILSRLRYRTVTASSTVGVHSFHLDLLSTCRFASCASCCGSARMGTAA